jgi:hypothetical protein
MDEATIQRKLAAADAVMLAIEEVKKDLSSSSAKLKEILGHEVPFPVTATTLFDAAETYNNIK